MERVIRHSIDRKAAEAALRHSEEQLRQAQKLEAIGGLAGGVAHDFNNLLSVILGYSALLTEDLEAGDPLREDLEAIHEAGLRAADLTRQLLAFSRQQVLAPRVLDINDVFAGMEKMLRRLIGEDVQLKSLPAAGLPSIKADPGQIAQVIMNLVVNARDAMPRGGQLTVETTAVVLDQSYADEHLDVTPGPHVMLAVSDSGIGMDKATQAHMFEPFFSTKEVHRAAEWRDNLGVQRAGCGNDVQGLLSRAG
jgi:signal transduction histidine kinase